MQWLIGPTQGVGVLVGSGVGVGGGGGYSKKPEPDLLTKMAQVLGPEVLEIFAQV